MNREIKQMLKLSISIVLIELVFVNLGGIFNQPPTELKTSYASWRVHTNRLRTFQIDQSPIPKLAVGILPWLPFLNKTRSTF
nr:hypothetical protein [Limosilactobacillus mucosae]